MRLENMKKLIANAPFDAILLAGLENPTATKNLTYMTGYTGTYGFALIGGKYQYFITDFRYLEQAKVQAPEFEIIEIDGGIINTLTKLVDKEGIKKLGFDTKVRYSEYQMYNKLPCMLMPASNYVESLRISKDEEEIKLLEKACDITDKALEYAISKIEEGMTEKELEVILKTKMFELGADSTWDSFIVASGERGAMPHGRASDKKIVRGEMITFDIGCFYKGYSSDLTRTVAYGEPTEKMKEIYNVVYEAQKKAVEGAKANMTGKELDALARDYITEKEYGEYFKHSLGHGLGLDIHEPPRASSLNEHKLPLNSVVTIEPGVYITGLGGVRIEDDVVLTEKGCVVLNKFPKELMIIK